METPESLHTTAETIQGLASSQDQTNAEAGEYWMAREEDAVSWPVVICDEEMTQAFFKGSRPMNALQANGTWKIYPTDSGTPARQRCYPALYLGIMKFRWVPRKCLEPVDFQSIGTVMKSLKNKDLIRAYDELLEFDIHNLVYWKDKLYATKLQEEQSSQHDVPTNKKKTLEARKRKRSVEFRDAFQWVDDGDDDDEGLFLTSNPEPIKGKNGEVNFMSQVVNRMSQAENDALYEDSDCVSHSKVSRLKKINQDLFGRCTTRPTPSNRINSTVAETEGSPKVSIYIGNPWEIVKVPLGLLDGSPFLQRELKHDSASGYQCRVMSPLLSKLTTGDFQPVTEFLACHEYHPRILDEGTPLARLQNITTNKGRRDEMMRCGTIYCVSHDLEMPTLGQLAIRKLKVLEPACLSVEEFLTVAGMIFRRSSGNDVGDDGAAVRAWLTNRLADRFWEFIMAETRTFVHVLKDNEKLAKGVFGILGRDGVVEKEAGGVEKDDRLVRKESGEGDEKGKDEGSGNACRDRTLAWFRGIPHEI